MYTVGTLVVCIATKRQVLLSGGEGAGVVSKAVWRAPR